MYTLPKIERFNQNVLSKFYIYNSVFITLPFDAIDNTGVLLPLFTEVCDQGFKNKLSPIEIVNAFAAKYLDNASEEEKINLLFRFIQYVERQIVLFDAIEDAAFPIVNNMEGRGSLREVKEHCEDKVKKEELKAFLNDFKIRTVLTAHPTQFYPGAVLGIITDLTQAIRSNDLNTIKELLAQLGKTPFIKKEKPSPYDEAVSLIWYLENVFYQTSGEMIQFLQKNIYHEQAIPNAIINLGFWPGGDRDGNPFVTPEITMMVAERLRTSILKCYYYDIRKLKRKLTFPGIDYLIAELENAVYRSVFYSKGDVFIELKTFIDTLELIKSICVDKHRSLYLDEINDLINKVNTFGFHFASLDIRQNSNIHNKVLSTIFKLPELKEKGFENYFDLSDADRTELISNFSGSISLNLCIDEQVQQTLESIIAIKNIQEKNGELGANRYIISNNESALNVLETLALFRMCNWKNPSIDIVPLFESVEDLQKAHQVMEQLYTNTSYLKHLKRRGYKQTIMLGFSDGTKDGGYLMANWSIYKAKEAITKMSRKYGIKVVFFDGRGGPPARGGGKTHKFYASLGSEIEHQEIQLTIQGQTISSNFGTLDSCRYNLENLLSAGISNELFEGKDNNLSLQDKSIIDELAELGFQKYLEFKSHPKFIPYLEKRSTLNYYSKTNIGSRPSKRNTTEELNFSDLRAIPFVGSWSQMKQNVPGFFGVGTALKHFESTNQWEKVQDLFDRSLFFRTLLENSMMSIEKSFFPLTQYMENDKEFGSFWQIIFEEFQQTKRLLLKISGQQELMENYPDGKASIKMREDIVLPLLTIQQYALMKINEIKEGSTSSDLLSIYEKLVTRSLFGNTNASRNSA
ncbi:phosphoenolpyruvate carboxylase [Flavobacterium sp. SUN046]|uniref:phosphoenolpyruvate carboxylase n=1 Tax=Flavobacterium sp. SUN046 TaxID=3002440 RepID=UPI002DB5A4AF|nr:phosphoenolpyruvate carboxylase [Flavobacterium sp. SUN046]MEC4049089.1 phosphoenolpyruvate carboxylase [Flavobacterium sp. SUN046]